MVKRVILTIVALILVAVPLVAIKASQIMAMVSAGENAAPPPTAVALAVAEAAVWQSRIRAVGTVRAAQAVDVSTESPGIIRSIEFDSGDRVKVGQTLVRLDTAVEQANLRSALAAGQLAEINFARLKKLRDRDFSTQSALQDAEASKLQADAAVAQARAVIERKTIRAPFSGRLGIRAVDRGQFLNVGTPVVELVAMTPVYVDFSLPQRYISQFAEGLPVTVRSDAFEGEVFSGKLQSVNARIDQSSRNIRLRAQFANPDEKLREGMFVDVEVTIPDEHEVVLIPATAVIYAPYGSSIYVAEEKEEGLIADQRFVRLGERRGDFVAVISGVSVGDRVVTAGAFKLRNGMTLVESGSEVDPQLAPNPEDT